MKDLLIFSSAVGFSTSGLSPAACPHLLVHITHSHGLFWAFPTACSLISLPLYAKDWGERKWLITTSCLQTTDFSFLCEEISFFRGPGSSTTSSLCLSHSPPRLPLSLYPFSALLKFWHVSLRAMLLHHLLPTSLVPCVHGQKSQQHCSAWWKEPGYLVHSPGLGFNLLHCPLSDMKVGIVISTKEGKSARRFEEWEPRHEGLTIGRIRDEGRLSN